VLAGFGVRPILTVPPEKAVDPLPPAVKVTVGGRKVMAMLLVTPVPGLAPLTVIAPVRVTVPAKLPTLAKLMVDTAEPPLGTLSTAGTEAMLKSCPGTITESVEPPVTARL
jgi:hypothetical protein